MVKQSRWKIMLSGTDPIAATRLNAAADEVNALAARNAEQHRQIASLFELDKAQAVDITRLQSALWILMQMLAESKVVDGDVLMARIKSAFDELEGDSRNVARPGQTFP
jgi:hypothetical protein